MTTNRKYYICDFCEARLEEPYYTESFDDRAHLDYCEECYTKEIGTKMIELKYFKPEEFACKCGECGLGYEQMDEDLLSKLDKARELADTPFKLTSAMRCEEHNKAEGGSPSSSHITGLAIDVSCVTSTQRYKILKALFLADFQRIGIAKNFIHVDVDKSKAAGVTWLY